VLLCYAAFLLILNAEYIYVWMHCFANTSTDIWR